MSMRRRWNSSVRRSRRRGAGCLVAGPLSAVLEDGNLRDIRFGGVEIVRAINYLARGDSWGTFKPVLSNLNIAAEPDQLRCRL